MVRSSALDTLVDLCLRIPAGGGGSGRLEAQYAIIGSNSVTQSSTGVTAVVELVILAGARDPEAFTLDSRCSLWLLN